MNQLKEYVKQSLPTIEKGLSKVGLLDHPITDTEIVKHLNELENNIKQCAHADSIYPMRC